MIRWNSFTFSADRSTNWFYALRNVQYQTAINTNLGLPSGEVGVMVKITSRYQLRKGDGPGGIFTRWESLQNEGLAKDFDVNANTILVYRVQGSSLVLDPSWRYFEDKSGQAHLTQAGWRNMAMAARRSAVGLLGSGFGLVACLTSCASGGPWSGSRDGDSQKWRTNYAQLLDRDGLTVPEDASAVVYHTGDNLAEFALRFVVPSSQVAGFEKENGISGMKPGYITAISAGVADDLHWPIAHPPSDLMGCILGGPLGDKVKRPGYILVNLCEQAQSAAVYIYTSDS